jgi:hypothetical protein
LVDFGRGLGLRTAGFSSGGADFDAITGEMGQERGGYLGAAGVVRTDEQDTRHLMELDVKWGDGEWSKFGGGG